MSKKQRQAFDHKLYRRLAKGIHDLFCEDFDWCNYGMPEPAELADDAKLPAEERQRRAGLRLEQMRHCWIAVEAENISAHIQFGKGAKVRKFMLVEG